MNTLDQKRQEQVFGGLYYEQDGHFHPVGDNPKYIDRLKSYGELVEKKTREKVIEEVKEIAWECLYQEWVEVAIPKNFEAGKLNCTLFEKKVNKLRSKQPTTKESND